jgi:hypothetical protein
MNEIKFSGKGKTDAGLTYGAYVELRPIGTAASDEAGVNFGGAWGTVELGQVDGASANMYITGSGNNGTGGAGGYDGIGSITRTAKAINENQFSGDDAKVNYVSPSINGLTIGLSYTPNNGTYNSMNEVAINYGVKFGDSAVNLAATRIAGTADVKTIRSLNAYHLGGSVSFGSITAAVGYFNGGRGGIAKKITDDGAKSNNGSTVDVGANVALGGGTAVGASVVKGSYTTNKLAGSKWKNATETWYTVGMVTPIADGANLIATVEYNNGDTGAGTGYGKSNTTQVLVGTRISF